VSKARLVITAVIVEGCSQTEVARRYRVSKGWVSKLVARYRVEGDAAFLPRSRRPLSSPTRTPPATIDAVLTIRSQLHHAGLDAGPETIRWHLAKHHDVELSRSTVRRILVGAGVVTPEPNKRPKASYVRFAAELPNECWQSDFTHYRMAGGAEVEILCWIDDHSRYALSVTAHHRVTGAIVLDAFRTIVAAHGIPSSTLTDNGQVYTSRFAGGRGGRNSFETELAALGVIQKNSRPNHPTTCGKVERFHQTLKRCLDAQPAACTLDELQTVIDRFVNIYNHHRPHRAVHTTPAAAYQTRPKATPTGQGTQHWRVRHDRVDSAGKITLRYAGRLYKIGLGRTHARTAVVMLIADLDIRIINAHTGELIRTLKLDPNQRYQPTGRPHGHPPNKP